MSSGYISTLVIALYLRSENVILLYAQPLAIWLLIPILLFWVSWVWLKSSRGEMHDDPIVFAAKDKTSLSVAVVTAFVFLYAAIGFDIMRKTATKIAVLYTLFAVLSTAINIGSQILSIWIYKAHSVEISILVGTAMGLPLRYFLEKCYIFNFTSKNLVHDGKLFVYYSAMGVITTLIFWGTEYAFTLFMVQTL